MRNLQRSWKKSFRQSFRRVTINRIKEQSLKVVLNEQRTIKGCKRFHTRAIYALCCQNVMYGSFKTRVEDRCLNMKGKRLGPLKTEEVKIVVKPLSKGMFIMKPRILIWMRQANTSPTNQNLLR